MTRTLYVSRPRRSSFTVEEGISSALAAEGSPSSGRGPHKGSRRPVMSPAELEEEESRMERYLEALCRQVLTRPLLVDCLGLAEVQRMANHPFFFVFEEPMRAALLAFLRDPLVAHRCVVPPHPVMAGLGRAREVHGLYPPSGVLPFKGLASFLAPVCYLYTRPSDAFAVFRAMYTVGGEAAAPMGVLISEATRCVSPAGAVRPAAHTDHRHPAAARAGFDVPHLLFLAGRGRPGADAAPGGQPAGTALAPGLPLDVQRIRRLSGGRPAHAAMGPPSGLQVAPAAGGHGGGGIDLQEGPAAAGI